MQQREDETGSINHVKDIQEEQISELVTIKPPTFKTQVALNAPMFEENEQELKNSENHYQCKVCEKPHKSKYGLQKHTAAKHEGIRYPCSQCSFKASQKGTLKNHVQFIHEGIGEDCPICHTKHATKHHLKLHIEAKHEERKYHCSQCAYRGSNKYILNQHKLNMHTEFKELHRCDQCENEYASKNRLQLHIAKKHEGKRYTCEECQFKASEPSYLILECLVHCAMQSFHPIIILRYTLRVSTKA